MTVSFADAIMNATDDKPSNATDMPGYGEVHRYITLVIFPIIMLAGVIGNLVIIKLTLSFPCLKGNSNMYIIHKSVCNVIISSVPTTMFMVETALETWPLGGVICNASVVIEYAVLTTSNLIMVVICVEQYFAVMKPFKQASIKYPKVFLAIAWGYWLAGCHTAC